MQKELGNRNIHYSQKYKVFKFAVGYADAYPAMCGLQREAAFAFITIYLKWFPGTFGLTDSNIFFNVI